ncbi:MAG TPA: lantibiotic dehydratase, partial [Myxococcales bacterium]|nr:lantibiotic dehydratase [Myxococcales bacterium]
MERAHLVSTPGTGFRFWRWFLLRSAGFPFERLEAITSPALGEAADRALEAGAAFDAALKAAEAALAAFRAPSRQAWRELRDLFRGARDGAEVDPSGAPGELRGPLAALAASSRERHGAEASYRAARSGELDLSRARLREVFGDEALREALLLQSRGGLRSVEHLPPVDAPRNHPVRRNEQTAALHLQRCCAKNDTISFFGPIACGALGEGEGHVSLRPAEDLVLGRRTFFEHWAMRALADATSADPQVRPHLRPRRSPRVRLDGEALVHPVDRRSPLPPGWADLVARCDGARTGQQLARELAGGEAFPAEGEVLEALEELREAGAVLWEVELPTATAQPERALRSELEKLPPGPGEPWLAKLDALESARAAFAEARGPGPRGEALEKLEVAFAAATGGSATRGGGKFYEARAAVYEDCVRGVRELRLGRGFLEKAGPALDLVLSS